MYWYYHGDYFHLLCRLYSTHITLHLAGGGGEGGRLGGVGGGGLMIDSEKGHSQTTLGPSSNERLAGLV